MKSTPIACKRLHGHHLPARELTPEAVVEVERALAEGATAVPDRA